MKTIFTKRTCIRVILCLLCAVLTLGSLPLYAADDALPEGNYAEAVTVTNDDGVRCTVGYLIYAEEGEDISRGLNVYIGQNTDGEMMGILVGSTAEPTDFCTVTSLVGEPDDGDGGSDENAQVRDGTPFPVYSVQFALPKEPLPEELAGLFYETPVGGVEMLAVKPEYTAAFGFGDGDFFFAEGEPYAYLFQLESPRRLIALLSRLYAEGSGAEAEETADTDEVTELLPTASDTLTVFCYAPDSVRRLARRLEEDKASLLEKYGYEDLTLYMQYFFSDIGGEEEVPFLSVPFSWSDAQNVISRTFSFDDAEFRAAVPEGVISSYEKNTGNPDETEGSEDTVPETVYYLDTEAQTISVHARFVLSTGADAASLEGIFDEFCSPAALFNCGATNTLISDPTALGAPVMTLLSYDEEKQEAVLEISVDNSIRDALVWSEYRKALTGQNPSTADSAIPVLFSLDVSVNGEEWHRIDAPFTEGTLLCGGRVTANLSGEAITDYAYIRFRSCVSMRNDDADALFLLESPYCDSVAYDKRPDDIITVPPETETLPMFSETADDDPEKLKAVCSICGICPAPYGVCVFLWIGAALLIVLLIVLIAAMIPKKRRCPRCDAKVAYGERLCPSCGYRFTGNMPDIEEEYAEDAEDREDAVGKGASAGADGNDGGNTDGSGGTAEDMLSAPVWKAADTAAPQNENAAELPAVTQEFLVGLKKKMTALRAGEKPVFTAAELVYLKALRKKTALEKAAKAALAAKADAAEAVETGTDGHEAAPKPDTAKSEPVTGIPSESRVRFSANDAARLRSLRSSAGDPEALAPSADAGEKVTKTAKTDASPSVGTGIGGGSAAPVTERTEETGSAVKPEKVRMIKCSECAVPNPETNERCYICGHILKK